VACNFANNVNSKIDVMNAYAAGYTDPVTDHEILYLALERNTNTGDANVGFWFLQDEVGCGRRAAPRAFSCVDASDSYSGGSPTYPKDSGFVGRQSNCTESTEVTFTNDAGPGTTFLLAGECPLEMRRPRLRPGPPSCVCDAYA
jgi:hypothetical protein